MATVPEGLFYARSHEWAKVDGGEATIGITDYAQEELTDVVYVELPEVGDEVTQGESFAIVESVKAASDVLAPVSGTVTAINEALVDTPELVNESPYEDGWFIRVEVAGDDATQGLLDAAGYADYLKTLDA